MNCHGLDYATIFFLQNEDDVSTMLGLRSGVIQIGEKKEKAEQCFVPLTRATDIEVPGSIFWLFFFFSILRRMGKNKALAHHTSTYFHTRRV